MKKIKLILPILMIAVMINASLFMFNFYSDKAKADYVLNEFDLVDAQKHMDWGGSTAYSTAWDTSVSKWNAIHDVIRKDTIWIIKDVTLQDYTDNESPISGKTFNWGYIKFNTARMNEHNLAEKKYCAIHLTGHALGIDDNIFYTNSTSVMNPNISTLNTLGLEDIYAFNDLYYNVY
jgi:hypothetical protein